MEKLVAIAFIIFVVSFASAEADTSIDTYTQNQEVTGTLSVEAEVVEYDHYYQDFEYSTIFGNWKIVDVDNDEVIDVGGEKLIDKPNDPEEGVGETDVEYSPTIDFETCETGNYEIRTVIYQANSIGEGDVDEDEDEWTVDWVSVDGKDRSVESEDVFLTEETSENITEYGLVEKSSESYKFEVVEPSDPSSVFLDCRNIDKEIDFENEMTLDEINSIGHTFSIDLESNDVQIVDFQNLEIHMGDDELTDVTYEIEDSKIDFEIQEELPTDNLHPNHIEKEDSFIMSISTDLEIETEEKSTEIDIQEEIEVDVVENMNEGILFWLLSIFSFN